MPHLSFRSVLESGIDLTAIETPPHAPALAVSHDDWETKVRLREVDRILKKRPPLRPSSYRGPRDGRPLELRADIGVDPPFELSAMCTTGQQAAAQQTPHASGLVWTVLLLMLALLLAAGVFWADLVEFFASRMT